MSTKQGNIKILHKSAGNKLKHVVSFVNKLMCESDKMIMLINTSDFDIIQANNKFNKAFNCRPSIEIPVKFKELFYNSSEIADNIEIIYEKCKIAVIKKETDLVGEIVKFEKINQFKIGGQIYALIKVICDDVNTSEALQLIYDNQVYKGITENALTGIFYADRFGNIIDVNSKVLEILGSPSALATKAINVLTFLPLIEIGFSDDFKKCVQLKTTICNTSDYITKWDKKISVNYSFTPIANRRGTIVAVLANIENIEKQRIAELKLLESETNYKNLFNSSVDGIIICDLVGKVQEINTRFFEMLGYTLYELNSIPKNTIIPEKWHNIEKEFVKKIYKERYGTYEKEYIAKSGKIIPVAITAWVMQNSAGEDDKIGAIVQDITQRKDTTEALKKRTIELAERIKELNGLYLLSKVEARIEAPLQEVLQELINILPQAMQCPENSHFELLIGKWHFYTPNFVKGKIAEKIEIKINKHISGLFVLHITPNLKNEKYITVLDEEKKLLRLATATLERIFRKHQQDDELMQYRERLEDLIALRTNELAETNERLKKEIVYRKNAELELREREAYYSDMFERNQAIKIIIDYETGAVIDANASACSFYGHTRDVLKRLNIKDFYSGDKLFLNFWREKINESGSFSYNTVQKLAGNIEKFVTINASLVVHKMHKFIFCVISDISAQKAFEAELLESENKFAEIFNTITDALFLMDTTDYKILLVNPSACMLYQRSDKELLGMKFSELYGAEDSNWKQLVGNMKYFSLHWHVKSNGQIFPVEIKTNNFLFKNRSVNVIVVRDITERRNAENALRESEQRYREISDNAPSFIWETDNTMCYTYVSKGVAKILQIDPEEIIGRRIFDLCHEIHKDEYVKIINEAFALKRGFNEITKCYKLQHGAKLWMSSFGMPMFDEKNNFIGFRGIDNDITERKIVHEAFQNALEKEKRLNQLKSKFITTVSHEFRTPLTLISSNAQLLEKFYLQLDEATKIKSFKRITETVKHMSLMLDNVSLIGKDESGVLEFNPVRLDIERFCSEIAEEIESIYSNEIPVKLIIYKAIGQVIVDKSLLQHVIRNLLTNAIKFSKPGNSVVFEISEAPGNVVEFNIKDKGIGIPEDDIAYIFEPFHRGGNAQNIKGTGLGMSIVKRCVELHNGTVLLESKINVGTNVKVCIPYLKFDN